MTVAECEAAAAEAAASAGRMMAGRSLTRLDLYGAGCVTLGMLVEDARTMPDAWHTVTEIAQGLTRAGEPFPPELRPWVIGRLAGTNTPPAKRPGRHTDIRRNRAIVLTVLFLTERYPDARIAPPDPGPCSLGGQSICDAVGVGFGGGLRVDRIDGLWRAARRCMDGTATREQRQQFGPVPLVIDASANPKNPA